MSVGGRILHHEKRHLRDPKSTILFIGYQAHGSLGRRILDGATEVKIHGESVPIKCHVKAIGGYSAHADQPTLVKWVEKTAEGGKLKKVFVVQGESESAEALAVKITESTGVEAISPNPLKSFEL
jgi:metallo-beta-lactamase family protein